MAKIAGQVSPYNIAGNNKMAYMLHNNHQGSRQNNQNSIHIEFRGIEGWQRKPRCLFNNAEIHNAKEAGNNIA